MCQFFNKKIIMKYSVVVVTEGYSLMRHQVQMGQVSK